MVQKPTYEELKKKIQKLELAESNRKRSEKQPIHSHDLKEALQKSEQLLSTHLLNTPIGAISCSNSKCGT
jgi:hypothetical protein